MDYVRNVLLAMIVAILFMSTFFGVGESSYLPPDNVDRRTADGIDTLVDLLKHHRRLDDIHRKEDARQWITEHKLLLELPTIKDQLRSANRELDTLSEQTHRNGLRLIGLRPHYTAPSCTTSRDAQAMSNAAASALGGQQSSNAPSSGVQINPQTNVGRGAGADGSR